MAVEGTIVNTMSAYRGQQARPSHGYMHTLPLGVTALASTLVCEVPETNQLIWQSLEPATPVNRHTSQIRNIHVRDSSTPRKIRHFRDKKQLMHIKLMLVSYQNGFVCAGVDKRDGVVTRSTK